MKRAIKRAASCWGWLNATSERIKGFTSGAFIALVLSAYAVYQSESVQEQVRKRWWPIYYWSSFPVYERAYDNQGKAFQSLMTGRLAEAKSLYESVERDYQEAIKDGVPFAKFQYGRMLCSGVPNFIERNTSLGARLVREAASAGDPEAKPFLSGSSPCAPGD